MSETGLRTTGWALWVVASIVLIFSHPTWGTLAALLLFATAEAFRRAADVKDPTP